jgi:hypothetical protein
LEIRPAQLQLRLDQLYVVDLEGSCEGAVAIAGKSWR